MRARSPLLEDANNDHERNDSRNVLSRYRLNLRDFKRSRLSFYQVFSKRYLKNTCFQLQQMYRELVT